MKLSKECITVYMFKHGRYRKSKTFSDPNCCRLVKNCQWNTEEKETWTSILTSNSFRIWNQVTKWRANDEERLFVVNWRAAHPKIIGVKSILLYSCIPADGTSLLVWLNTIYRRRELWARREIFTKKDNIEKTAWNRGYENN